jgi:hypothetical protein
LPKECPHCALLKPPRVASCPACGFTPIAQSKIECTAGELHELTPAGRRKPELSHEERARLFGQLKAYARQHSYAPGWAAHKYREKTGVWPRGLQSVPEIEPEPTTQSWIRSRQIAWGKRGGRHDQHAG